MGGQNHQPTNRVRLIAPSAWLSQRVGEGFAAVLHANSELENAIMVGMDRLHVDELAPSLPLTAGGYMTSAISKLEDSLRLVEQIRAAYAHLLSAADIEGYRGNPLASKVKAFRLADAFSGTLVLPGVNGTAWVPVESSIEAFNILRTLEWEAKEFDTLIQPTFDLVAVLNECSEIAVRQGQRQMVEAIECNEVPLRQRFARVFSLWNHLHAMFLYSALMMTELFYRTNAFGTLLMDEPAPSFASEITA